MARMEELSHFYDENIDDEKIHFFENLRIRIKKVLQMKVKDVSPAPHYNGVNEENGNATGLRDGPDFSDATSDVLDRANNEEDIALSILNESKAM